MEHKHDHHDMPLEKESDHYDHHKNAESEQAEFKNADNNSLPVNQHAAMNHGDHAGDSNHQMEMSHDEHTGHGGHGVDHSGHEQMFRQRFWVSLILSIPVLLFSPSIQGWLNFSMPAFPGSQWITPLFGVIVFIYGGVPFL